MRTAIIGLPQVGKTSLFKILTGSAAEGRVGSTKVQLGVSKVPDGRLEALAEVFQPRKVTPATVEYADMPGLSREALSEPSYIGSLRTVDAFAHVLRLFDDPTVMHIEGTVDPRRDWESIDIELMLNDLQVVENRLERLQKDFKRGLGRELATERHLLGECRDWLEADRPLREMPLAPDAAKLLRGFQFLTAKPILAVLNVGEDLTEEIPSILDRFEGDVVGDRRGVAVTAVCGSIESELVDLDPEERDEYLASYGLAEPGVARMVSATYRLLGLMSFLTVGEKECRAWTVRRGATALTAAGTVHTDFAKRFIRAETIQWRDLVGHGSYAKARAAGELRLEGKDYVVQDGDVLAIRHS